MLHLPIFTTHAQLIECPLHYLHRLLRLAEVIHIMLQSNDVTSFLLLYKFVSPNSLTTVVFAVNHLLDIFLFKNAYQ